jgi:hypothetical protein
MSIAGAEPRPPEPGEALLVSVGGPALDRGALWRLHRPSSASVNDRPFGPEARRSLELAQAIVSRDIPLLFDARARGEAGEWQAELVWDDAQARDWIVDGRSYGLAMLLAEASRLMGVASPADLVCSAEILSGSRLGPVEGLERKMLTVHGSALAVRRILVASEQRDEATQVVRSHSLALEIVGCHTVGDAMAQAFSDVRERVRRRWDDPAEAAAAASRLFFSALEGAPLVDWRGVAAAAEHLLSCLSADDRGSRSRAAFAQAVARRHAQEADAWPIPMPAPDELAVVPRPIRQRYLAHVVQSHNDGNSAEIETVLQRARRAVPALVDCHPEDLELLGAIGRALAALRRHGDARALLHDAVRGWVDIDRAAEASHSLCELVRVLGILRDRQALEGPALCRAIASFRADPSTTTVSHAYLRLALGRAFETLGDHARALRELAGDDADWDRAPRHVRAARLRWWARALTGAGDRDGAARERGRLSDFGEEVAQRLLADIDDAIETDADCTDLVERLARADPQGMRQLGLSGLSVAGRARVLVDEWPY